MIDEEKGINEVKDEAASKKGSNVTFAESQNQKKAPHGYYVPFAETAKKIVATRKDRVAIETVIEAIRVQSEPSFDYFMLIALASAIAASGLASDSAVSIIAAMLVSPLMGPILGTTFGFAMRDGYLVRRGLKSTLEGLLLCLILGYLFGLFWTPLLSQNWPSNCNNIPSVAYHEMCSRGVLQSVWISATVAVPSGMGVALSVLGSNTSGLVGVAISASLLPPAVNCGMLLAFATIGNDYRDASDPVDADSIADSAGISLLITVVNIVCIYVFGIVMFRIKEVAPFPNKTDFWKEAVPFYRDLTAKPSAQIDGCCGNRCTCFDACGLGFICSFQDKIKILREYVTEEHTESQAQPTSTSSSSEVAEAAPTAQQKRRQPESHSVFYDPFQYLRLSKPSHQA